MPTPVTLTVASSGTMTSQPPRIATTWMETSRSANRASRRSISPPPSSMKALKVLRHHPVALAGEAAEDGDRARARSARRRTWPDRAPRPTGRRGHVRGPGVGQVMGDRLKLGVGLRRVHGVEALVELVHGQPPVARGLAQHVGDALPVGVGGAQVPWIRDGGRATHISQA